MRIDDYKNAIKIAAAKLREKNPEKIAALSGSQWHEKENNFTLTFFTKTVVIQAPEMEVKWQDQKEDEEFSLTDAVLILHYLLGAKGLQEATEDFVAYRQIPGGEFYAEAFKKRAEEPLAKVFGNTQNLLSRVASFFKGDKITKYGDECFVFQVFPHIKIICLVHWADDEFESTGQVLFNSIIGSYFPNEDISWLGSALVYRLMGAARSL